jgi:hypothetical protein
VQSKCSTNTRLVVLLLPIVVVLGCATPKPVSFPVAQIFPTTTTSSTTTWQPQTAQQIANGLELDRLVRAGLVVDDYGFDHPVSYPTMGPSLQIPDTRAPDVPNEPAPLTLVPPLPVIGQGCTRDSDGVMTCPPITTTTLAATTTTNQDHDSANHHNGRSNNDQHYFNDHDHNVNDGCSNNDGCCCLWWTVG